MGITFLYPSFLWALTLVSIPIIIHLFNFRKYKTVYFSNVSLIKEIQQDSKKTRSIRNWLILLIRILAIVCLVLAFAFPMEKSNGKEGRKIVSLYIDNSFSMDSEGLDGNKFDLAKSFADQIVQGFDANTKFQIITNDFLAKHQFLYNQQKTLDLISEIPISNKSKDFQLIYNRQFSILNEQENSNPNMYWISDFQNLTDSTIFNPDSIPVNLCLIASGENKNINLDSVWFESPVRSKYGNEKIQFRVQNLSSDTYKAIPVYLTVNNNKSQQSISLKANETKEFSFSYVQPSDSIITGEISIEDAHQNFDNQLRFSYQLQNKTNVLVIHENSDFKATTNKLFAKDSTINYQTVSASQIDFSMLNHQNLIILGELNTISSGLISELSKAEKAGCNVAVFPGEKSNLISYKKLTSSIGGFNLEELDTQQIQIESVLQEHSFFTNVFKSQDISKNTKKSFPILKKHFPIQLKGAEPLMYKEDGSPFLVKKNNYYFCSSGITKNNSSLRSNSLIVPIFYQLVFNAIKSAQIQYFTNSFLNIKVPSLQNNEPIQILKDDQVTFTSVKNGNEDFITMPSAYQTHGHFQLKSNNSIIGAFSINNNRLESKEINEQMKMVKSLSANNQSFDLHYASSGNAEKILKKSLNTRSFWFEFLLAGFILLILEMLIIRILGR